MIVIIGAGICGLGIGWQLAKAGCPVTIVDRGEAGRATSWAAAGTARPAMAVMSARVAINVFMVLSIVLFPCLFWHVSTWRAVIWIKTGGDYDVWYAHTRVA